VLVALARAVFIVEQSYACKFEPVKNKFSYPAIIYAYLTLAHGCRIRSMAARKSSKRPHKYWTKNRKAGRTSRALTILGRIGGKARAEKLTSEERLAIAIKASRAAAKARTRKAKARKAANGGS
jgi:hypothetical protein